MKQHKSPRPGERRRAYHSANWGGARPGAGRKPKGGSSGVGHVARDEITARRPVQVTVRVRESVGSLREPRALEVVTRAFESAGERPGFRVVQHAVRANQIELTVEARDRDALGRGMQGLIVRIARGINGALRRRGRVVEDRYEVRS